MGRAQSRIQPTFRASREGLGQVLGDLERAIMETLWTIGAPATVSDVQRAMADEPRAYHTVTTVMVRLCEKGLLKRRKRSEVWHYAPALSRDEFERHVARQVIKGVFSLAPEAAISSMLDIVAATDPEGLEALARLIKEKKRQRGR
mgnify:CR=1 FL=1